MIKIQSNNQPIVWQVDTSYLLPAQSGQVRWNGSIKQFEVCDNNSGSWYKINNTIELTNNTDITTVLDWAKKKMQEEEKLDKLMSQYPSLKSAKEQFDIVHKLVQQDEFIKQS